MLNESQHRPGATISVLAEVDCNERKQTAQGILLPGLCKGCLLEAWDALGLEKVEQR